MVSILEMPISERLQLVEAIWDSIAEIPESVPVTADIREELDRRLDAYYRNPTLARPWADVRKELFGTK